MPEAPSSTPRAEPIGPPTLLPPHAAAGTRAAAPGTGRAHLLTVALEDYYQTFPGLIDRSHWYRFETRVDQCTHRALDLLDERGVRATFFTSGWTAEQLPELIREVVARGHEVAAKGYDLTAVRGVRSPAEFRDDAVRAREVIEAAARTRVHGYRAPGWLAPNDDWALGELAAAGFAYDSSVKPLLADYAREPERRFPHTRRFGGRTLWELPVSSLGVPGLVLPVGAGNYFRQLPPSLMNQAVAYWDRTYAAPFMMYFHTWELDPSQPQITGAPLLKRVRVYRNLERVPDTLRHYFGRYAFTGIGSYLGLPAEAVEPAGAAAPLPGAAPAAPRRRTTPRGMVAVGAAAAPAAQAPGAAPLAVTVVVPCYNEEQSLAYLANTLDGLADAAAGQYAFEFVFVDDGSTDDTVAALQRTFGGRPDCTVLRHPANKGAAQAILTGIRAARTEVVASIDADCTYDPLELRNMIPLLVDGVDVVTGSPYHRAGRVSNVPGWRLALSRTASALYRLVLGERIATYTSFFRVYRRSAVLDVRIERGGYLGIAEMLGRLALAGSRVAEYPTTLNVRMLGHSKMKVARTTFGHVGLLAELALLRLRGGRPARPAAAPADRVAAVPSAAEPR